VTVLAAICALVLGVFAGITHGMRSAVMNHVLDTLLSIPSLLLAIIVVAFLGPRLEHAMLAVFLALIPRLVREIYTAVHDEMERVCGGAASRWRAQPEYLVECGAA